MKTKNLLFVVSSVFSIPFVTSISSCNNKTFELFKIDNNILKGFNPNLSEEEKEQKLNDGILNIPENVISISDFAFANYYTCDTTIPRIVKKLAFDGENIKTINSNAFRSAPFETINFSNSIEAIKTNAFRDCWDLTNVIFGNDIKYINDGAFRDCWDLTSINLPSKLVEIGNSCFYRCGKLTSRIILPDTITKIGDEAFHLCKISYVKISNALIESNSIGDYAFSCCPIHEIDLTSFGNNVAEWTGTHIFDSCTIDGSVYIKSGISDETKNAWKTLIKNCGGPDIDNIKWKFVEEE